MRKKFFEVSLAVRRNEHASVQGDLAIFARRGDGITVEAKTDAMLLVTDGTIDCMAAATKIAVFSAIHLPAVVSVIGNFLRLITICAQWTATLLRVSPDRSR